MLVAFGSVFNTDAGLYLLKDNNLLLAMPIPVAALVGSHLIGVYLMGLLYSVVVIFPAIIVYWITAGITLQTVIGGFVYMALLFAGFMLLPGWILGFCGYKSVYISIGIPVVTEKRCCHFFASVMTKNM